MVSLVTGTKSTLPDPSADLADLFPFLNILVHTYSPLIYRVE
jgi:hypothetical protein